MITEKELRIAGAAHLSTLGYYVEVLPDVPFHSCQPDVVGILPRLRDLKRREKHGTPPAGLIYLLLEEESVSLEEIVGETQYEESFVRGVLQEAEMIGWVRSEVDDKGNRQWSIKDYKVPVKECVMLFSGIRDANRCLKACEELKDCYHKGILLLTYEVTSDFIDLCFREGIGILRYHERIAYFSDLLPPEWKEVKPHRAYLSLCEKVLHNNLHFREGEGI